MLKFDFMGQSRKLVKLVECPMELLEFLNKYEKSSSSAIQSDRHWVFQQGFSTYFKVIILC